MVAVGEVISGKYKLLRLLGDGGMGSVYEAEHLVLGTHVAIKVLHGDLARRSGLIERFLQEARVSAQIQSPHVVQVTDVDRTPEGVAYLVMELLQGEPLSNVVKREGRLGVGTATEYALQILGALEAAHALGVIHRDLKPDNVFVTFAGGRPVIKLIDFGIAKLKRADGAPPAKNLTVAGMLMGTPEYMAPEQAYAADKVDVRADLYAVGCMIYEMLSGKTPVSGDDPRVVVLKVERGEVTPLVHVAPSVPAELAGFVHRAMAPRPELRFANATEMRLALEAIARGTRPRTAPLAATAGPHAANPAAFTSTADAPQAELGTGTVMGAPAAEALASRPPPGTGLDARPGTSTVRAAPLDPGITRAQASPPPPMMPHGPGPEAYSPSGYREPTRPPPRRKGNGLVVALALVALLLGAGAVFAWVLGTSSSADRPAPLPTDTVATSTPTTPPTSTPPTPPAVVTGPTPPLTAPPLTPVPQAQPAATPRPTATAAPPTTKDAGAGEPAPSSTAPGIPPFTLPSGFPSALPLPSGFPSAFPFPSGFPPWPPPPPP